MASTDGGVVTCPCCKGYRFNPHCSPEHPTCTWVVCKACGAVVTLRGKRRHTPGKRGHSQDCLPEVA